MGAITDHLVDRNRHLFMYDDERLINALAALRDANGQDWWHLVVSVESGGYAVARFSDLEEPIRQQGAAFLESPLSELVGVALVPVEVVVDQGDDLERVQDRAFSSRSQVAVVEHDGEFRGIIPVATRKGLFESNLLTLAGEYAAIPQQGVVSRRRLAAKNRKTSKEV